MNHSFRTRLGIGAAAVVDDQDRMVMSPSLGKIATTNVTRPNDTTAYASGDVQGASTSATAAMTFLSQSSGPLGEPNGGFLVTDLNLRLNLSAVPSGMAGFRLHLYSSLPASAYGDNAAWDLPSGDTGYQGYIDIDTPVDMGSTLFAQMKGINKLVQLDASGNLYGYLVTLGAYTPTALATRTIRLFGTAL